MAAHKLPPHPLVEDGYPSIGCMPCTRRIQAGEEYRAGRWAGLDKDECGIHIGVDGDGSTRSFVPRARCSDGQNPSRHSPCGDQASGALMTRR